MHLLFVLMYHSVSTHNLINFIIIAKKWKVEAFNTSFEVLFSYQMITFSLRKHLKPLINYDLSELVEILKIKNFRGVFMRDTSPMQGIGENYSISKIIKLSHLKKTPNPANVDSERTTKISVLEILFLHETIISGRMRENAFFGCFSETI